MFWNCNLLRQRIESTSILKTRIKICFLFLVLMAVTYIPALSLWLPGLVL